MQLGSGLIFGPTLAVISHWFKRKRGAALGFVACGSSLGGTIFPIAFKNLVFKIGYDLFSQKDRFFSQLAPQLIYSFPWTMRVLGFILVFTLTLSNLVGVFDTHLRARSLMNYSFRPWTVDYLRLTWLGVYSISERLSHFRIQHTLLQDSSLFLDFTLVCCFTVIRI